MVLSVLQSNNLYDMKIKLLTYGAVITIIFCGLLVLQSCGGKGSDPSPADQMKTILTSGTWNLQNVSVDGVDKSSIYSGLTLRFTEGNFTTTNGRVVWPASGTWEFSDDTGKNLTRGDGVPIGVEEATTSKLVLKLTWNQTTLGQGRANSVKGVNVFTFGK
jgi:hypothetical protein